VRVVRLAAAGVASGLNFSIDEIEDIKLAVAEACNNAILHAAPQSGKAAPTVTVRLYPASDRLEIQIQDEGRVGDSLPRRGTPRNRDAAAQGALPEGGLGLLIIESLMDDVRHLTGSDTNTTLRMVKYVRTAA
jgi:serine/threonine-protein kinase RsbW